MLYYGDKKDSVETNEKIAKVKDGLVYGVSAGRTNITAYESLDGRQAILMINVREKKDQEKIEFIENQLNNKNLK